MNWALFLAILILFPALDLLSSALFSYFDNSSVVGVRILRDGLTIYLAGYGFLIKKLPTQIRKSISIYIIFLAAYSIMSIAKGIGVSLIFKTNATLLLPVILFLAGYASINTSQDFKIFIGIMGIYMFASFAFGLWETNNTDFWQFTINYGDYLYHVKGIVTGYNPASGLPWNFTGHEDVRRAAGILAVPLANAYFGMSIGFVWAALCYARSKVLSLAILSFTLAFLYFTHTRGALICLLASGLFIAALNVHSTKAILTSLLLMLVGAMLAGTYLSEMLYYTFNMIDGSTVKHLLAFRENIEGLSSVVIFGYRIGAAGQVAAQSGLEIQGGGEGAFFSLMYQTGVSGGLAFLAFYCCLIRALLYTAKTMPELKYQAFAAAGLLVGLFTTFVTTELLFTYSGMAAMWFIVGGLISISSQRYNYRMDE